MIRTFFRGLGTGFILQLAVGPVFFFVLNVTVNNTLFAGLAAVAGVAVAVYLYITLAALGVGRLMERKPVRCALSVISAVILVLFGCVLLAGPLRSLNGPADPIRISGGRTVGREFLSALLLTLSSPLTIVFWTGLFAAKALEYDLHKGSLLLFGLSAGLATPLFLGTAVLLVTAVRGFIPPLAVPVLNSVVGVLLIGYGVFRLIKSLRGIRASRLLPGE